ncbi:hypothetical protein Tco_0025286 [Tanacetum coccineum]
MYYPRFTKVIIHYFLTKDKIVSKRNKIGMHTSRDDYLINTLRFVSTYEESQIYGAQLPKSMTSPEMRETEDYKTYLGCATGVTPPKKAQKFKKPASPKLTIKSTNAPTAGVVIRDTPMMSLSKKKEKITVEKHKGIDLLYEVALTKEAQYEEVRKKSLRDFHKTHPSGSGIVTKIAPSVAKIKPSVINEGTGSKKPKFNHDVEVRLIEQLILMKGLFKRRVPEVRTLLRSRKQGNENLEITLNQVIEDAHVTIYTVTKKTEVLVTSSSHSSDLASKFLNFLDIPHTNAEIVSPMDVHVHHEVPSNQTPTLLTVPVSVITKSSPIYTTVIPQSLPSFTPLPPQSTPTPPPITEATNRLYALLNFASIIQFNNRVSALEKEVAELKKGDLLNTQVTALDHKANQDSTSSDSTKEVSNFALPVIKSIVTESLEHEAEEPAFVVANSDMSQDQEENIGNDDEEPKRKVASKHDWFTKPKQPQEPTDPDWNVGKTPQQRPTQSWLMTLASSADKPSKTFDELMSTPIDFSAYIMNGLKINNMTQETLLGQHLNFSKAHVPILLSWNMTLKNVTKLFMNGNRQIVPVDYFFNNDLKYLQGGISTMTYTTSIRKKKVAQYDLPGIEDMVPNIWSPVKVAYDKYALWGISHWRQQRKTFYGYARGLESSHDVYSTKRILAVTRFEVMRKHGYGYLREIEVPKVDNEPYIFKEGDFPRLRINDIKDMLILIVQNRLTNLSGDDVFDFAIALRMFTRSMVIQKRVEDLQLRVESCQKKINVTKPETTRPDIKKGTHIHHIKTIKDSFMLKTKGEIEYPNGVLAIEKMEFIRKEKSSYHDQGY